MYNAKIIKQAIKFDYDIAKAISEYTILETKYSKNIFIPEITAQQKAFEEMQDKMLQAYIKKNG